MSEESERIDHERAIARLKESNDQTYMPFEWDFVGPVSLRDAVRNMSRQGLSITFTTYLEGRTVSVRVGDREGQTVWHCVTGDELDVLLQGLALPEAASWARQRFTPYSRGSRRR